MYKLLIRPLLFLLPPERAHHFTFQCIKLAFAFPGVAWLVRKICSVRTDEAPITLMGLTFRNRVGLAAGFDKDARLYKELYDFGFGFIEIGTLTPRAQAGNPKPRMFRLPADRALINRMGFNNAGVEEAVKRLRARNKNLLIGGNIGKNKDTPNEKAADDYRQCFHALFPYVDYFVVNVSSPNTPGLRELQEKEPLRRLLLHLIEENKGQTSPKPILLKIAPDLNEGQLADIAALVLETGLEGVVAGNTTLSRNGLISDPSIITEAGGLSGAPLAQHSNLIIASLRQQLGPDKVIIGVGGVFTRSDYQAKLRAGADLVQVYTGFIYEGPMMIRRMLRKES